MKAFATLLLLASLALNAAFLTGCVSWIPFLGDKASSKDDDGRARLVRIAEVLDIPTEDKSAYDLECAISHVLNRAMNVPQAFGEADFEKMAKDLNPVEREAMQQYQRFILGLQGKRVIVMGGDD